MQKKCIRPTFGCLQYPKVGRNKQHLSVTIKIERIINSIFNLKVPIISFTGVSKPDAVGYDYFKLLFAIFYSAIGKSFPELLKPFAVAV